jgi:hypothetical protein
MACMYAERALCDLPLREFPIVAKILSSTDLRIRTRRQGYGVLFHRDLNSECFYMLLCQRAARDPKQKTACAS